MTVPARNIYGVEAHEPTGLHDHVFQNLVNSVANMNITVRIRRAIVQDELRLIGMCFPNLLVQFIFLPLRDPLRFAFSKIAPHWEGCI